MNIDTFLAEYNINLNNQQLEAVQATDGPVLLLAVPGSGKTTVLVTRLGYMLLCKEIPANNILTITYTVAATNDMRDRFASIYGEALAKKLEFRTINGICAKIIIYYSNLIGKKPFNLISDEKEISKIVADIYMKVERAFPTESDIQNVRRSITYIKNMMLNEKEIKALEEDSDIRISKIYNEYRSIMRGRNLMDFDDQMVYAYNILKINKETLNYFRNLYKYICVDEAQDTSKIQHLIIAALAGQNGNLFMVGDEDQSIYGFRAAYPDALLTFEKIHSKARVLLMEQNYRSTAEIVEPAAKFISANTLRHEKTMIPTREVGTPINIIDIKRRSHQYSYLLKVAADCTNETAILFRNNECALPLIDLFERNDIPYKIRNNDLSFFTNKVVMDIRNIIRFASDMRNAELFMQIYYKMSTYINKASALHACEMARVKDTDIMDAAISYTELSKGALKASQEIYEQLKYLNHDTAQDAISRIVYQMGYEAYMDRNMLDYNKIGIIRSLALNEKSAISLDERMNELNKILQNKEFDKSAKVILSTIHSSKGLEYDTVYMIDVFDGLFPEKPPAKTVDKMLPEDKAVYEEERRLFYVGMTRARNSLNIFYQSSNATFIDQLIGKKPKAGKKAAFIETSDKEAAKIGKRKAYSTNTQADKSVKNVLTDEEKQRIVSSLQPGTVVTHKKFGEAIVRKIDRDNLYIKLVNNGEEKKLSLSIILNNNLIKV